MASLTDFQNSTITLLDYLYFHDIVALETFSDEKLSFYEQLVNSLLLIVEKRGYKNLRAEHYQHLLLVGIDLNASYIGDPSILPSTLNTADNEKIIKSLNDELCSNAINAGFCLDELEHDLYSLLDQYPLAELSRNVLYKIVGQILYYQFDNITVCVLSRLLDHEFITLGRYVKHKQKYTQRYLDIVFFRAMLFLEYEAFKTNLLFCVQHGGNVFNNIDNMERGDAIRLVREKAQVLNTVPYRRIYQIDLIKKNDLKKYLTDVNERLGHTALLTNHLANWIGLVGAWHVIRDELTNQGKTVYRELAAKYKKEPTCCKIAKEEMIDYGFEVSERTLYDTYKCIKGYSLLIGLAVNEVNKTKLHGALEPVLTKFLFYNPIIGPSFKRALEKVNANLKNKKAKI